VRNYNNIVAGDGGQHRAGIAIQFVQI